MSASEIVRLFGIIAPLTMRNNNYKEAKNNVIWQGMYLRTDRSMFMVNIAGAVMLTLLPTYPCHYCGLIQPEDEIEVDHRQPKSGPMGWGVAKVLHSLNAGLTTAGASGHKNTDLLTSPPRINPKGWQRGVPWVSYDFTRKRDRYTLTDKGRTFLTVACMVYGIGEAGFPSICINSLFNLVPSCGSCNRTKGRITFVHKS